MYKFLNIVTMKIYRLLQDFTYYTHKLQDYYKY